VSNRLALCYIIKECPHNMAVSKGLFTQRAYLRAHTCVRHIPNPLKSMTLSAAHRPSCVNTA